MGGRTRARTDARWGYDRPIPLRRTLALALFLVVGSLSSWTQPAAAQPSTDVLRAYELAYNLDHEEGVAALQEVIAERPNDQPPIAAWLR